MTPTRREQHGLRRPGLPHPVRTASCAVALLLTSGCGTGSVDSEPVPSAIEEVEAEAEAGASEFTSHPRWETVTTLEGEAEDSVELLIAENALQWRSQWRCEGDEEFLVAVTDALGAARVLTDAGCPATGESLSVETGHLQVDVETTGAWELTIDQYVDTFLDEPPLPEMQDADASIIGEGDFYGIERKGSGRAILYELSSGRLAIRLEDFSTLSSPDLFLWISQADNPETSSEVVQHPSRSLGPLMATYGHQNYVLPDDITVEDVHSIVIWCEPFQIAYTAAIVQ